MTGFIVIESEFDEFSLEQGGDLPPYPGVNFDNYPTGHTMPTECNSDQRVLFIPKPGCGCEMTVVVCLILIIICMGVLIWV